MPQIRCKDCKYYEAYRGQFYYEKKNYGYCTIARMTSEGELNINVDEDFYCAYAERKKNENTN